jgi:hypothetical protein
VEIYNCNLQFVDRTFLLYPSAIPLSYVEVRLHTFFTSMLGEGENAKYSELAECIIITTPWIRRISCSGL